jgi:hypothetical protein
MRDIISGITRRELNIFVRREITERHCGITRRELNIYRWIRGYWNFCNILYKWGGDYGYGLDLNIARFGDIEGDRYGNGNGGEGYN